MAKITQFTLGAIDRSNPATNLMTGGMTSEVALNGANLLSDIKPGYMLGAKPRQQAIGHVLGIFAGAVVSVPIFYAVFMVRGLDQLITDQYPMPAAVVWRIKDTARAILDIDNVSAYVPIQAEAALRHLANEYSYDAHEDDDARLTLRGGGEEIVLKLKKELQERFEKAGLHVEDARLTHLAYAPEIAGAMLRRQQAEAVIAARKQIVHGAVSMVEMALQGLTERGVVDLDAERRAAMVSNLLVVLCAETEAQPVINAGTLYG